MTFTEGVKVPKKTPISEAARERETFRYDDSLFSNIRFNDSGIPIPSCELVTSPDAILTALTRLAASQTGTARSLISLFDQSYQYIVAEATPAIPLLPSMCESARHHEDLWLCGTAIPRAHGACELTLCADDPEYFDAELPVLVVDDLASDPRFSAKPYCQPGSPARFYAAVPIRTGRGVNIGVLCVIDTKPGTPWHERHSALLQELSRAVTDHLEASSFKKTQKRSERMSRGLRSFVEGDSTLSHVQQAGDRPQQGVQGEIKRDPQPFDSARGMADAEVPSSTGLHISDMPREAADKSSSHRPSSQSSTIKDWRQHPETPDEIFAKASRIVKDAVETDGCLFLNADILEYAGAGPSTAEWVDDELTARRPSSLSHSGSEDVHMASSSDERPRTFCQVLGSSDASTLRADDHSESHVTLPQTLLARMIRRYPRGCVFNFDANGEPLLEDLPEEAGGSVTTSPAIQQEAEPHEIPSWGHLPARQETKSRTQQKEASLLLETFPKARSIAFVPIWDPRKERWSAGGFVHTLRPNRTFTLDLDLAYLRALGMLAAAEAFRLETIAADRVKSDALGSLSHELRSPLHGAVLSVELLNDTDLSVSQKNIVHTIEVCCRTLSDTIDHLLDYSKVNNLRSLEAPPDTRPEGAEDSPVVTALKQSCRMVQLDVLVKEVMESVYAGFNFQHVSIAQLSNQPPRRPGHKDITSIRRLDTMQAMEDLSPTLTKKGDVQISFGDVSVFLIFDTACSWAFYTHPGPMRRIVMNLFGNALKYTRRGAIEVRLEQSNSSSPEGHWVTLTVSDTGVGIGEDFLQNDLFRPFSQEDHLKSGTGLGLSFVKQITTQFGGHISVNSRVGVGTTVTVSLPMRPGDVSAEGTPDLQESQEAFEDQLRKLRGLRVRVLGFNKDRGSPEATIKAPEELVQDICRDQLHMQVVSELESEQLVPDLVICSEDILDRPCGWQASLSDVPSVVACASALTAHQYATGIKATPLRGISEFISQPGIQSRPSQDHKDILSRAGSLDSRPDQLHPTRNHSTEKTRGRSSKLQTLQADEKSIHNLPPKLGGYAEPLSKLPPRAGIPPGRRQLHQPQDPDVVHEEAQAAVQDGHKRAGGADGVRDRPGTLRVRADGHFDAGDGRVRGDAADQGV
ncbi:hypothetical protein ACJZ2D_000226 [Fusarium nematophilum]